LSEKVDRLMQLLRGYKKDFILVDPIELFLRLRDMLVRFTRFSKGHSRTSDPMSPIKLSSKSSENYLRSSSL